MRTKYRYSFGAVSTLTVSLLALRVSAAFQSERIIMPTRRQNPQLLSNAASSSSSSSLDEQLYEVAKRLKRNVLDLEGRIYGGYESKDNNYGLQVVHSRISLNDATVEGLGIELTEVVASTSGDGLGLVLISDVFGAAAIPKNDDCKLQVGDVLTGVSVEGSNFRERLTGLDYDRTVEAIGRAKQAAAEAIKDKGRTGTVIFDAERLVERATITVELVTTRKDGSRAVRAIDALAGENLRRLLQRNGVELSSPNCGGG
jgi:hypothetical protein